MLIKVEVKNEFLGDHVFWVGDSDNTGEIRNICAQDLAVEVSKDGISRNIGMWYVSEVKGG